MTTPGFRKTKIVCTIGPASGSREAIANLIKAGMNIARLNFSHGTHEEHTKVLKLIREEAEKADKFIAVFQDLCGPKVRIGQLEGGEVTLEVGKKLILAHTNGELGTAGKIFVEAFDPAKVIKPGEKALLADGRIEMIAKKVTDTEVECEITAGGLVRSRSGIAVPESKLNLPCLTEKDKKDLVWAVENDLDYVALSFVGSANDIFELRQEMEKLGKIIPVISKIERASSLDNITSIIEASDVVMVARGDLGLELPLEKVPSSQRLIIETANFNGTPVITATQMLMSMVKEIRPTRAEVTDVSTAVRDGTDAVMLSDETAIGAHPIESVQVLSRICLEAEKEFHYERYTPRLKGSDREKVADAVCYAACNAADKISASALLACTMSGYTARLIAKYRPQQNLYGVTPDRKALTRMAAYWGVEPVYVKIDENFTTEDEVTHSISIIRDKYGIKPGSRVVVTAGLRAKKTGSTCIMEIREVPRNT
ncbi:MAG: pyruvate kinase [Proteobacteria bacterium]|nr:pyruvate kinase [Pseudomonadota bacterium]